MARSRRITVTLLALSLLATVALAGCGPGGQSLLDSLNLKGENRYTVGDQVYAAAEIGYDSQRMEISLYRRFPEGQVSTEDVDALSAIDGIELTDEAGDVIPLSTVSIRPTAGESGLGYVVLVFPLDSTQYMEHTWSLQWPGYDPLQVNDPASDAEM